MIQHHHKCVMQGQIQEFIQGAKFFNRESKGVRESRTKPKSKRQSVWELKAKPKTRAKLEKKRRRGLPPEKSNLRNHSFWCQFEINDNMHGSKPWPVVTNPRQSLNSLIISRFHWYISILFLNSTKVQIESLAVLKAFSHEPPTSHYRAYHMTAEQRSGTFIEYE